jgi:uncharacterized lipoprotein YajG
LVEIAKLVMDLMMRYLAIAALLLTAACAWTEDTVTVQRQAVPVAAVPGAANIGVAVTAADARQEREISHKKNGYGMRGANILAANDVLAEVREGVREIIAGKGFMEGGDAIIRLELSRFYNTFDMHFFSATGSSQVSASLQVIGPGGRSLYARVYTSNYKLEGVQILTGENAASGLRIALTDLLRQIADDQQLNQALLQVRPVIGPMSDVLPLTRQGQPAS